MFKVAVETMSRGKERKRKANEETRGKFGKNRIGRLL